MIVKNKNITYQYNPFGGLSDIETQKVLVPKLDFERIINEFKKQENLIIEFVGKKGRGKTSHLKCLNQICKSSQYFSLSKNEKQFQKIIDCKEKVVLIDSIHHLSFLQRLKIYRSKKKIVLTSHIPRTLEYKIANTTYKRYRFKGLKKDELITILKNRIILASNISQEIELDKKEINQLLKKHKDDYRAILHFLYVNFQNHEQQS